MKKSISVFTFFFVMVLSLFSFESAAADVTSTFKVNGSCPFFPAKVNLEIMLSRLAIAQFKSGITYT